MSAPLVVSLSGGKDSTAMLLMLLERGEPVHSAVFFDTGWEFPQMHEHIVLLREAVAPVPIVTLHPPVPFLNLMMHQPIQPQRPKRIGKMPTRRIGWGWSGPRMRWCSGRKTRTIDKYIKSIPGAVVCVGFADDEANRVDTKNMRDRAESVRFPLLEYGVTEADALAYCRSHGFHWGGLYDHFRRVSCFCCPLQPLRELRLLRRYFPDQWALMLKWDREMPDNRGFKGYATVHDLDARFREEDRQLKLPGVAA